MMLMMEIMMKRMIRVGMGMMTDFAWTVGSVGISRVTGQMILMMMTMMKTMMTTLMLVTNIGVRMRTMTGMVWTGVVVKASKDKQI